MDFPSCDPGYKTKHAEKGKNTMNNECHVAEPLVAYRWMHLISSI